MKTDKKYNGWTNYETWNIALWLDQDAGGYWQEQAAEFLKRAKPSYPGQSDADAAKCRLADALKESHEEEMPELTGPYADLLNAALSEVNWYEIASGMIDEIAAEEAR